MSIITGIINVLTTSPVKEILVNIVAGASLDGIKKIVSNFQKDSVELNFMISKANEFFTLHFSFFTSITPERKPVVCPG